MYHSSCFRIHSMLARHSIRCNSESFYIFLSSIFAPQSFINPHYVQCADSSVLVGYSYITNGSICSVACPANSSGINVPAGCSCNDGYSGIITMSSTSPYYSGSCSAACNWSPNTYSCQSLGLATVPPINTTIQSTVVTWCVL